MNRPRTVRASWLAVILIFFGAVAPPATAYEVETHELISQAAVGDPEINRLLIDALGLPDGRSTTIKGKLVERWIMEGAKREDDWGRFVFHFHNPLTTWDESGLFRVFAPSVLWAQEPTNAWSWDRVRLSRTNALSKATRAERETAFVDLLRGLGQLIHLIQDTASPAHTRNDPHASPYNYEGLVLALHKGSPPLDLPLFQGLLNLPIPPDAGWRSLPTNPLASPSNTVAKLIDSELYVAESYYVGANPEVTLDSRIGLAEYTNANFLSEDSTWESQWLSLPRPFRYPARPETIEDFNICEEYTGLCAEGGVLKRRYYMKEPPGDAGYHLATVGFLRNYFVLWNLPPTRGNQRPALDETVYRDYARQLLRRAVGYSVAFLVDFLNTTVKIEKVDPFYVQFTNNMNVRIEGRFEFYYEKPDGNLYYWYVNRTAPVVLEPGESMMTILYSLSPAKQAVSCRYIFKGQVGEGLPPLPPDGEPSTWPAQAAHAIPCPIQEGG